MNKEKEVKRMRKELSREVYESLVDDIKEKYVVDDLSPIEEQLWYVPKEQVEEYLEYETYRAFVGGIENSYARKAERIRQLNLGVKQSKKR